MNCVCLDVFDGDVFGIYLVDLVTKEEGFGNGEGSVLFCCAIYACYDFELVRVGFVPIDDLGAEKSLHEIVILPVNEAHNLRVV